MPENTRLTEYWWTDTKMSQDGKILFFTNNKSPIPEGCVVTFDRYTLEFEKLQSRKSILKLSGRDGINLMEWPFLRYTFLRYTFPYPIHFGPGANPIFELCNLRKRSESVKIIVHGYVSHPLQSWAG